MGPWCHLWLEFFVRSRPCSEGFSPGSPVFLPPQKPTFQIPIRLEVDEVPPLLLLLLLLLLLCQPPVVNGLVRHEPPRAGDYQTSLGYTKI